VLHVSSSSICFVHMTITRVLCLSHDMIVPVSLYQEWFHDHMDNPYPDMVDISELSVRTGLTIVSLTTRKNHSQHRATLHSARLQISPRFANLSPLVININDPVPYDNSLIFSGSSLKLVRDCTSAFGYDRPCSQIRKVRRSRTLINCTS
jgi:hypothetical protein